ncbi:MAG TPA: TonB-dependent receptor [Polyangiales bacterium]|nr:TonB-dependent receptor [Polyangiales bacterium]
MLAFSRGSAAQTPPIEPAPLPPPAAPPQAGAPAPAAPPPAAAPAPAAPAPESAPEPAPSPPPPAAEPAPAVIEPAPVIEEPEVVSSDLEQPAAGGEMVVTGSRIRDAVGKQAPVTTLSQADLARPGLLGIGEILQRQPSSGSAINGKTNLSGNQGNPPDGGGVGAGATEIDLRYLGSKRVLVLVDGVRWINGSSASGVAAAVDLNTIPLNMIERIEILEDGASPIYGSDAIAGVVNIITRKSFRGAEATAQIGGYMPTDGAAHGFDGLAQKYDLTFGTASERLSIVAGASYVRQNEVLSRNRDISNSPIPTLDNCEQGCSSGTPQGRVSVLDPNTMEMINVTPNVGISNPRFPGDYHGFGNSDRFNFAPYNLVLTPSERIGAFTNIVYRVTDMLNLHAKAAFTRRQSVNQAAPEPLFVGPDGGTGTRMDTLRIDASNPYNPFGFSFEPDPMHPYVVTRRPVEAGPRRFEQTVNTLYLSAGLDGKYTIGDQPFIWDTTFSYGINRGDQRRRNSFNSAKLAEALGPAYMGDNGKYMCGSMAMPGTPGCVPFNIFGGEGTITPEMLRYVTYTQHDVSEQRLFDWVANTSGQIVRLPGGPLAVGVGVEHRRLQGFFEPDSVVAAGDSADIPAQPTSGKYHVSEAYAEARVPVVAHVPAIALLDLNAAGRVSKYSFLDPELTGKFGGRYKPIDDLVIRASYGMGFRAPSIGELYGTASRFDAQLNDPCHDFDRPDVKEAVRQSCIAKMVPADGSYKQLNQQISVATGGNPNLEPERSKSLNVSIAYAPAPLQERRWSDRFDVELAYWQIELTGAIAAVDAQLQLDRCIGGDDSLCQGITRIASGTISSFSNKLRNLGGIETRGLDFKVFYQTSAMPFGRLRARWASSWLIDYIAKIPTADGTEDAQRAGKVVGEPEKAYPRLKSNLTLDWLFGDFDFALTTRYIHKVTEPCRDLAMFRNTCSDFDATDDTNSTNILRPTVYNDIRVTWIPSFDDKLTVSLGVNNIFNVDPPACYSCALNGFNGATYDIPGAFGYLSAGYTMQ